MNFIDNSYTKEIRNQNVKCQINFSIHKGFALLSDNREQIA